MKGVDSTFLIDVLKNAPGVASKALELEKESVVFTTEANVFEIVRGIHMSRDERQIEHKLHEAESLFGRFIVAPLERRAALRAGEIAGHLLKQGRMIDDADCLAAGILLANGCDTIVTRNVKHFERIEGLKVETY
jgi:predicted nucleic acid-binding protein